MKTTKKIFSMLLALLMVLGLSMTAFAADGGPTSTLIVSGKELAGKTVTATKMFTASWVDSNNDGKIDSADTISYTLDTAWEDLFFNGTTGENVPEGKIDVRTETGETLSEKAYSYVSGLTAEADLVAFAARAAKYKASATDVTFTTATATAGTAGTDGKATATFGEMTPGYYLVQPEGGSTSVNRKTDAMLVNVPSQKSVTLEIKSEYPTVDKEIVEDGGTESKTDTAQIGDTVNFKLTSKVPDMTDYDTYTFKFHDTMSKGLTFDANSVKVTINDATMVKDTDYTVTSSIDPTSGETSIVVEILKMKTRTAGQSIVVTYSATLNKDAVIAGAGNENKATVEYSNKPGDTGTGESTPDITKTYTYDIIIDKYTGNTYDEAATRLAGAVFELKASNTADAQAIKLVATTDADGATITNTYHVATQAEIDNNSITKVTNVKTDGTGKITIQGLKADTYYLYETEAPDGYNKLADPIVIEITADASGNATYTVDGDTNATNDTIPVQNKSGSMLPETGGIGTIGLTALGVAVVAGGLLSRKKKEEKE